MFRPIKNFITYIQKNASSSAMFGNGVTNDNNAEALNAEAKATATATATTTKTTTETTKTTIHTVTIETKKLDTNGSTSTATSTTIVPPSLVGDSSTSILIDDEDDLELQIESSVMLKNPLVIINGSAHNGALPLKQIAGQALEKQNSSFNLKSANAKTTVIDDIIVLDADPLEVDLVEDLCSSSNDEQSEQCSAEFSSLTSRHATPVDDELQDFANDPMPSIINYDLCAVDSPEVTADKDAVEDLVTEDEEDDDDDVVVVSEEDSFSKLEQLPDPDLIIVNDGDLNSSIASDAPSEDPLATDESTTTATISTTTTTSLKDSLSILDASTNDYASGSVEMLWHHKMNGNEKSDSIRHTDSATSTPKRQPETPKSLTTTILSDKPSTSIGTEQQEELRSDGGSDSGLGSETSALQTTLTSPINNKSLTDTNDDVNSSMPSIIDKPNKSDMPSVQNDNDNLLVPVVRKPLRSNLKRRLDAEDDPLDMSDGSGAHGTVQTKKLKRSINFDTVQVFYFPRQQGFGCVPSAGGCTLGMGSQHVAFKTLTLAEHAAELRRAHRLQLQENPRGSSSEDSEESEEDYLSEGSGSDLDAESNGFLQPMSPKQRRALLKAAGVRKIDASEKLECRDIRNSREVCGCTCRDFCDPETCACSQAGIKCQVDRAMFPCGCSRDACGNSVGRVEFNPARVRTHFIHTIMRLEMENRQQQNPASAAALCGTNLYGTTTATITGIAQTNSRANYYNSLQTQSNYSSGYASPAYMPDHQTATTANTSGYYQQTTVPGTHYATDLHATAAQYHQLDSLDGSLFAANSNATPAYGELIPNYSTNGIVSNGSSLATPASYHQMSYGTAAPVSLYSAYHHQTINATNYPNAVAAVGNTFSSCAVPSVPPYGTVTTTTASAVETHYQNTSARMPLNTIATTCSSTTTLTRTVSDPEPDVSSTGTTSTANTPTNEDSSGGSSFINLNTPIASASRISQINDLLQHNRNTTATLVAVAKSALPTTNLTEQKNAIPNNNNINDKLNLTASDTIDTPATTDAENISMTLVNVPPIEVEPSTPIVTAVEIDCDNGLTITPPLIEPPP